MQPKDVYVLFLKDRDNNFRAHPTIYFEQLEAQKAQHTIGETRGAIVWIIAVPDPRPVAMIDPENPNRLRLISSDEEFPHAFSHLASED